MLDRRTFLLDTQNKDGGWPYFPGKHSWTEPTVYAALALHGTPAADRAWQLIQSWALPGGGWRTSADVESPNWTAALCIRLHAVRGVNNETLHLGLRQLLTTIGGEGSFLMQFGQRTGLTLNDLDMSLQGWPWHPNNTSWIEPTAHSLVALKQVRNRFGEGIFGSMALAAGERIRVAEQMLLARRTEDAGWNYGNRRVRDFPLPSYPETTALGLFGLQGTTAPIGDSLARAKQWLAETHSPLATAWLRIALRSHNQSVSAQPAVEERPSQDILLAALQCLAQERT